MRFTTGLLTAVALSIFAASTVAHADSILVGSDLSAVSDGAAYLCPQPANCSILAQQFTLLAPVVIDDIKVALSSNTTFSNPDRSFSVNLGSQLGSPTTDIGSGDVILEQSQFSTIELFDFENLNISLGPGTYYLGITGANVLWNYAPAVSTSAGMLDQYLSCDPTFGSCQDPNRWDSHSDFGPHAMEIDGSVITPEPSSIVLLGTGLLGLAGMTRRKFFMNISE